MSWFSRTLARRSAMRANVADRQRWLAASEDLVDIQARGFRGWHAGKQLPHLDRPGVEQFVTFRLADSLPRTAMEELKRQVTESARLRQIEKWLDAGLGQAWLRRPELAQITQAALLHHHGSDYELFAWVIMPTHVHVVVGIGERFSLAKIVGAWKSVSAHRINRYLGRTGAVWQEEVWDRFVRSPAERQRVIEYVEGNPVAAHLTETSDPQEWAWSSARWRKPEGKIDIDRARTG